MNRSYWLPSVLALAVCALVSLAAQSRTPLRRNAGAPAVTAPEGPADGVFNVRGAAFGATGNGVVDDTEAIQNAINAASVAGGTVYFPAGVYRTTRELMVRAPKVSLRGAGSHLSTLRVAATAKIGVSFDGARLAAVMAIASDLEIGARTLSVSPGAARSLRTGSWLLLEDSAPYNGAFLTRIAAIAGDVLTIEEASPVRIVSATGKAYAYENPGLIEGISIRDLAFESAEGSSAPHAALVMINRANRAIVDNCRFSRSTGPLLGLVDSRSVLVERSIFEEAASAGGDGIEGLRCTACSVVNSEFRSSPFGIVFSQSPYTHIAQNTVRGRLPGTTNGRGIKVQNGSAFSRIVDNTITDSGLFGIYSSDSANVMIANNTIFGTGTGPLEHGIQVGGFLDAASSRNLVATNVIDHVAGDGIAVNPTNGRDKDLRALVIGNQIHEVGTHGIQAVASRNLVTGNLVDASTGSGVRTEPGTSGNAVIANQIGAARGGRALDLVDSASQVATANAVDIDGGGAALDPR